MNTALPIIIISTLTKAPPVSVTKSVRNCTGSIIPFFIPPSPFHRSQLKINFHLVRELESKGLTVGQVGLDKVEEGTGTLVLEVLRETKGPICLPVVVQLVGTTELTSTVVGSSIPLLDSGPRSSNPIHGFKSYNHLYKIHKYIMYIRVSTYVQDS
jgi:hypothetical protein